MIENKLVNYSAENGYYIDDTNGYMPAVLKTDTTGKFLSVVTRALKFDLLEKVIVWEVLEFIFNPLANKYTHSPSGRFESNFNTSTITVDNNQFVDSITGQPCLSDDPNAIGEFDFYVETLGKNYIYPALQGSMTSKIQ